MNCRCAVLFSCLFFSLPLVAKAQEDSKTDEIVEKLLKRLNVEKSDDRLPQETSRSVGIGREQRTAEPPQPVVEVRVYDLADLFAIAPSGNARGWIGQDHVALLGPRAKTLAESPGVGGMGGMGGGMGGSGGMFSVPDERGELSAVSNTPTVTNQNAPTPSNLIRVIMQTIPGQWEQGDEVIECIGSSLVVSAFPETHISIGKLLDLLRTRWNARVTMNVHLRWVWLNSKESLSFDQLISSRTETNEAKTTEADFVSWYENLEPSEGRPLPMELRLQCHNGQTVAWVSGGQRRSVQQWSNGSKTQLVPQPVAIASGLAVEVTPMLAHASSNVTLDVRSRYIWRKESDVEQESTRVLAATPRPDSDPIEGQTIESTVRFPVGTLTIIGGGTSVDTKFSPWSLYLVASTSFASPPTPKAAPTNAEK